ncbi:MAG: hypothetical protein O7G87_06970, partial [bacterium]|nr:hypothetical protein [bacterium]
TSQNEQHIWEMAIGVLALIGIVILYKKRVYPASDWAIWTLISILPFLNNPPDRLSVGPSRHLYFASLGSSFVLAWGIRFLVERQKVWLPRKARRIVFSLFLSALILSSILSLKRAEALSIYYTAISNKAQSLQLFERAVAYAPSLVPLDIYSRMFYTGLLEGKLYPHILEDALLREPDQARLNMLLGVTSFFEDNPGAHEQGEKRIQDALKRAENRLQMQYHTAVAFQNLAVYLNRLNHLERAIHLHLKALQYYPNYTLALYSLGSIYVAQRKNEQAIEAFLALAQVYEKLEHRADAILSYQTVLGLNPEHPIARAKLKTLQQP